jgi:signal transduction histidine kinase
LTATAVGAFVAGVAATVAAVEGEADPGVVMEAPGGHVVAVATTGFAWQGGVRPGQVVVSVSRAENGWELETYDGAQTITVRAGPAEQALRDSLPLALAALAAGALALLLRQTRRDWVVAAGSLGFLLASTPLWLSGNPDLSTAAMGAAAAVPTGWLASRVPGRRIRTVAWVVVLSILALWAIQRSSAGDWYPALETVRGGSALLATGAVIAARIARPALSDEPLTMTRPAFFDLLAVGGLAAMSVTLVALDAVSPILLGAGLILVIVLLPVARRAIGRRLQNAVFGDVREHARAEGADEERSRLARELHDDHLQELVGVIRRLEVVPGTEDEREDLRDLAGRLRTVASELRPPVLDDFGLPAALEFLAEQTILGGCAVTVGLDDQTGLDARQRPPEDIELAMYRIAGEAIANAVRHARASCVTISGSVSPDAVELRIADDGVGIDAREIREAARRNRFGLSSMRHRARAIDADLEIEGTGAGTTVTVRWRR